MSEEQWAKMPRVLLYSIIGPHLVIQWKSGVVYQNQACGTACAQPEMEGILAPLDLDEAVAEELERVMTECHTLTEALADQIDALLRRGRAPFVSVDRERLHDSFEAWVFVRIGAIPWELRYDEWPREYTGELFGFTGRRAVLTWPNSD
ncbi:DUF6210 family protein [Nannocystis sp. SCPEA4]|uniref:DUF6210 family protein n=1 Tax=Nannocystis sp. SCPEA4 TaxID=2996787 RepID=UPI00226FCF46|nr:DUF6210 family protein [Nannocystis sp. SCPEA4]MCY1053578.1 DUF6210 family protein [Nannocystis sp. SCPEA4]